MGLRKAGANETADMCLIRPAGDSFEALLGHRSSSSSACPGMLAIPGGFAEANETALGQDRNKGLLQTALREIGEEANIFGLPEAQVKFVGRYEEMFRDPRNESDRWTVGNVFCALVPEGAFPAQAGDDLDTAEWISFKRLEGATLAFDHGRALRASCRLLGAPEPRVGSWAREADEAPRLAPKA